MGCLDRDKSVAEEEEEEEEGPRAITLQRCNLHQGMSRPFCFHPVLQRPQLGPGQIHGQSMSLADIF